MTKQELIERIYRTKGLPSDLTKKTVSQIVDAAFDELAEFFSKAKAPRGGEAKFTFPGFGTFTKKRRAERRGRNPQTGEPLTIPSSYTLAFAPGQELRARFNHGK